MLDVDATHTEHGHTSAIITRRKLFANAKSVFLSTNLHRCPVIVAAAVVITNAIVSIQGIERGNGLNAKWPVCSRAQNNKRGERRMARKKEKWNERKEKKSRKKPQQQLIKNVRYIHVHMCNV